MQINKNATHVINSIPPINGKDVVYRFLESLENQTFKNEMVFATYLQQVFMEIIMVGG